MMTFNDYWKEKSQKRRKSWAAKTKRFAEQHTQLEDIRKEVYLPLDFGVNFSFEDYKPEHPSQFLDAQDDCYLVYSLGEVGSHTHPVCYSVFPPTHPVPENIAAQLRENLCSLNH